MANYKISPAAEADLYRIWLYGVHRFGLAQAVIYFFAFFDQFELIAQQPYLYQAVDYIRKGYRRCVCRVDSIYYRIDGDIIVIMAGIGRQDNNERLP